MISRQFALRLQSARKRAGLTQDELATVAECSSVTLSKLETGTNLPTLDILVALALALKVSPDRLLGFDGDAAAPRNLPNRPSLQRLAILAEELPEDWVEVLVALAEKARGSTY